MAITMHDADGRTDFYIIHKCGSHAHAKAAQALLDAMPVPEAYAPAIALADGYPATGGGESSQTMLDGGEFAPDLPPAVEALQERAMADDPQVGGLKAGEADHV